MVNQVKMNSNYQHPLFNLPDFMLDILPIEIWVIIYKYVHQLEFINIQKEFLHYKKNYVYRESLFNTSYSITHTTLYKRIYKYGSNHKSIKTIIINEKNGIEILDKNFRYKFPKKEIMNFLENNNLKIRKSYSKEKMIQQLMKC